MNHLGKIMVFGLLGLHPAVLVLPAQDVKPAVPTVVERSPGRVLSPESPSVDVTAPLTEPGVSLTPTRPRSTVAPEIRDYLRRFNSTREAYLREQEELEKQLSGATEADRRRIRQRIQTLRDAWISQSKALRKEATERQRELKRTLSKHGEALDETRKGPGGKRPVGLD